mgnify:CR=1 FL=1
MVLKLPGENDIKVFKDLIIYVKALLLPTSTYIRLDFIIGIYVLFKYIKLLPP